MRIKGIFANSFCLECFFAFFHLSFFLYVLEFSKDGFDYVVYVFMFFNILS